MQEHNIQINTGTDRLNFALHAGAGLALMGAAIAYSNPIVSMFAVGVTAAQCIYGVVKDRRHPKGTPLYDSESEAQAKYAANYTDWCDAASQIADRLNIKTPKLYVLERRQEFDLATAADDNIYIDNDFIFRYWRGPSDPSPAIAHELAHIKAGHGLKEMVSINIGTAAARIFFGQIFVQSANAIFGGGSVVGVALPIAASVGTVIAAVCINASYAKRIEYWADRTAARMTSPKAVEDVLKWGREDLVRFSPDRTEEKLIDIDRVRDGIFSRNPSFMKRIAKLRAMSPA